MRVKPWMFDTDLPVRSAILDDQGDVWQRTKYAGWASIHSYSASLRTICSDENGDLLPSQPRILYIPGGIKKWVRDNETETYW